MDCRDHDITSGNHKGWSSPKAVDLGNHHVVLFPPLTSDLFRSYLIKLEFIGCNLSSDVSWYHHIQFEKIQSYLILSNFIWFFLYHLYSCDPIRSYPISSSLISFDIICSHKNSSDIIQSDLILFHFIWP